MNAVHTAVVQRFIDRIPQAFREGDGESAAKTAENDNVRLLQSIYKAIADGDLSAFAELLDEEIMLEIVGTDSVPFLGAWHGRPAVVQAVERNFGLIDDQQTELHTLVAQGDTVIVTGRELARRRETGRRYDIRFVQCHTFRNGKALCVQQYLVDTPG